MGIKKLIVDSDSHQYGKDIESLMDKVQRKKQGSKAFKKALTKRDYYLSMKLPSIKDIILERLIFYEGS